MTTVIELTEQELADPKAFTRKAEDEAAVRSAVMEYLRFSRRMQLKALSGQVQMDDNSYALESAELRERHGDSGPGFDS